ncbi:hypothetical protein ES705_40414 [subsurface metagenome]
MKKLIFLLLIVILIAGCKKEEKSSEAIILDFSVTNTSISDFQLEYIILDQTLNHIVVLSQTSLAEENPPISLTPEITISDRASVEPGSGVAVSFDNKEEAIPYVVTAEDGTQSNWFLTMRDKQLPNSGFEDWFDTIGMDGQHYLEPGLSATSTIWATANMATSIYGKYGTTPLEDGENTLVKIVTDETSTVPITAGTVFTGTFDLKGAINNPTDPAQSTDWGIPFTFKPTALKVKFKYTSGENYIKCTLINPNDIFGGFDVTPLEGEDLCYIWSNLEVWDGENVRRIARAELISPTTEDVLTETIIPYEYISDEKPTHIVVVTSSSKDGEFFTGSVGSTLIIDDIELVYE